MVMALSAAVVYSRGGSSAMRGERRGAIMGFGAIVMVGRPVGGIVVAGCVGMALGVIVGAGARAGALLRVCR